MPVALTPQIFLSEKLCFAASTALRSLQGQCEFLAEAFETWASKPASFTAEPMTPANAAVMLLAAKLLSTNEHETDADLARDCELLMAQLNSMYPR